MRSYIVDGYNALHALPRHAHVLTQDLEQARDRLVQELSVLVEPGQVDVTVVFDAHRAEGAPTYRHIDGVRVVFGTRRQSADHIIERMAYTATRTAGHDVMVVTNDRLVSDLVTSMGAGAVSIAGLDDEMTVLRAGHSKGRPSHGMRSDRLEDGMDAALRERFEKLRRGIDDEAGPS